MQVGDTVLVKVTRQRALIVGELTGGRYEVEFLPDPANDPVDRDSPADTELGGIYSLDDLEPIL